MQVQASQTLMQTHTYPAAYGPVITFLAASSAAAVLVATAKHGPWLNSDAVHNIYAARSLLAGNGYLQYGDAPFVRWPPLFPSLLALLGLLKIEPIQGARVINAFALGSSVLLAGRLFRRCIADWRLSVLAVISISFSLPLLRVSVAALSEPVFVVLLLIFVLLLARYVERSTLLVLVLMAFCAALAALQRYIGVATVLTGIVLISGRLWGARRGLIRDVAVFGLLSGVPLAGWLLRNYLQAGTLTGHRTLEFHALGDALLFVAKPIIDWFIPIRVLHPEWALVLLLAAICLLVAFYARRAIWNYVSAPERRATLKTLVVLVPIYLLFLVYAVQKYRLGGTAIDPWRFVAPLYIFAVLAAFMAADLSLAKIRNTQLRLGGLFTAIVFALGLGFMVRTIYASPQHIYGWNKKGAGGYNHPHWKESPTMLGLKSLPTDAAIFTNDAKYAVYVHTGRKARNLQAWSSPEDPGTEEYFVWFDRKSRNAEWLEFYAASDLCRLDVFDDGAIFQMRTDSSTSSSENSPCIAARTERGVRDQYNGPVGPHELRRGPDRTDIRRPRIWESDNPMSLGPAGAREAWDRKQMANETLQYLHQKKRPSSEEDKASLERVYEALVKPKRFVRLRNPEHYSDTAQSLGWVFYDKAVAAQLVTEIDDWWERSDPSVTQQRKAAPSRASPHAEARRPPSVRQALLYLDRSKAGAAKTPGSSCANSEKRRRRSVCDR